MEKELQCHLNELTSIVKQIDHSVFKVDYAIKEIRYNKKYIINKNICNWKLDDNILTLTKSETKINWLIHAIEEHKMTDGVQMHSRKKKDECGIYKAKLISHNKQNN